VTSRGKQTVVDIYSENTGMTVRVNAKTGDFETLIDQKTWRVEAAERASKTGTD